MKFCNYCGTPIGLGHRNEATNEIPWVHNRTGRRICQDDRGHIVQDEKGRIKLATPRSGE